MKVSQKTKALMQQQAANERDAKRYRKLRGAYWGTDIVWDEAYYGINHARGKQLDEAVDAMPFPTKRDCK